MLKYRARIPLKEEEADTLPKLFREWASGRNTSDKNQIEEIRLKDEDVYASRFVRQDTLGTIWKTDLVYSRNTRIANVFLSKSYIKGAKENSYFKPPKIVERLYDIADEDHGIPTKMEPIILSDLGMSTVKALVSGKSDFVMPVVYVSTQNSTMITDPGHMAEALKGIAHVIVSFNPEEDRTIFAETESQFVPMDGRISVFLPGEEHPAVYAPAAYASNEAFEHELIRMISSYSMQTTHENIETWEDVLRIKAKENRKIDNEDVKKQTEAAKTKIAAIAKRNADTESSEAAENARESAKKLKALQEENRKLKEENSEMEALIDGEIDRLQTKIDERNTQYELLQTENMSIQRENESLKARLNESIKQPVLYRGTEKDYYKDEAKEVILDALERQRDTLCDCREKDVLDDILANNISSGTRKKQHDEVKAMLSGYTGMTDKLAGQLRSIGITVSYSKHIKIRLQDDSRYTMSLSETPSDRSAGCSAAREINRKFF